MDLHLRHITLTYPDGESSLTAVDDVSLSIPSGTTTALLGPSGSGKSSLLAVAGGLTTPTAGAVSIGEDVVFEPDTRLAAATNIRRDRIGIVFQSPQLLASLTALEQLELHAHLRGRRPSSERSRALDLLAEELRLSQNALNTITGEFTSDDLLGVIFSSFCIGK